MREQKIITVVCEGQSENGFVKKILAPYIGEKTGYSVILLPYTLITSTDRRAGRQYRGGLISYEKAIKDIQKCLGTGSIVTTMFDFYALPKEFPGYEGITDKQSDVEKVDHIEKSILADVVERFGIREDRFIPYIQLHEFEALFYCDLNVLKEHYPDETDGIDALIREVEGILPEDIDQGAETAPSKRLLKVIRYRKGGMVVYPLVNIGIDRMRNKCPHFDKWVEQLLLV